MKHQYQAMLAGSGALIAVTAMAVPVYAQGMRYNNAPNMRSAGMSKQVTANRYTQSSTASYVTLNSSEASTLQYMLEEEKLAHDIYVKMYEKWGVSIFDNISKSESKHQSQVASAATYYGVADARTNTVGVFTNTDLQKLYDTLLAKGLSSQTNAYEVGKLIEEQDIADLQKAISESNSSYLDGVYGRLLNGSQNHLRAFNSQLAC